MIGKQKNKEGTIVLESSKQEYSLKNNSKALNTKKFLFDSR